MSATEELRAKSDNFFLYLKYMWWPEIDASKLPPVQRQYDLFQRIYTSNGTLKCSFQQFNSILTECYQPAVGEKFFNYFFPGFSEGISLGSFVSDVFKFMKIALWQYGNLERAMMALKDSSDLCYDLRNIPFDNICPISESMFINRTPFGFMTDLTAEERYALGYAVDKSLISNINIESCQQMGEQNTIEYLSLDTLDAYVATSMRSLDEFRNFATLINNIFNHPDLKRLNIRYFDPTISYCKNRITKGLLEALMLKRARLTLYIAGEKDTFGKDSECAATLVQGKTVIVYIEKGQGDKEVIMDNRAKLFKELHPLGLQVIQDSGVANGVIVVRTPEECRDAIRNVLLHTLKVRLDRRNDTGYVLKDDSTESILRVAADDRLLIKAFDNYYSKG